jgi:hypothetical protein
MLLILLILQDLPSQVSAERLLANVQKLSSFKTLYVGSSQETEIGAACRWIHQQFEEIAKTAKSPAVVEDHEFVADNARTPGKVTCKNVVLKLTGKRNPNQAVVFGGHYDSIHFVDRKVQQEAAAPGANDNASGTSAVLELARIFAPHEFDHTLIFIAFSAEEEGLLGADAFAKELKKQGVEVLAMLNNDTIGSSRGPDGARDLKTIRCYSAPPEDSPSRRMARWAKHVVETAVKDFTLTVQDRIDRPGRGGDHQPFSDAGWPAIRLIEALEDVRNQHNDHDTAELIDKDYLANVARADAALLAALADALPAPQLCGNEWKPVDGAKTYLVFVRTSNDSFKIVDTHGKTSCSEKGTVCVCSVNPSGTPGLPSEEIELK